MCLSVIHSLEKRAETISKLKVRKDGYTTVYKVFGVDNEDNLIAQFKDYAFYEGKNTARCKYVTTLTGAKELGQYQPGFHSFLTKGSATQWMRDCNIPFCKSREMVVYPVKIKKEWITGTGYQNGATVIVSKHMVI